MAEEIKTADTSLNALLVTTDWSMFKKESQLGEGAYGTVFKVKCLKTSTVSTDNQRILLNN